MTSAGCVCVNGRFGPPESATVSALDAGFLLGDGLFESLRAFGGTPYLLDRHLDRLQKSAAALGFPDLPPSPILAAEVQDTLRRSGLEEAYLRVTISRGRGGIGLASGGGSPTRVIAALPLPPRLEPGHGAAVVSIPCPAERHEPGLKSTSWQFSVMARRRVEESSADEGLYVSPAGDLLEGISSNLFLVEEGALWTPPSSQCLSGVTRGRIIELASDLGIACREAPLSRDRLLAADEAFVTNAVRGIRPVRSLDGEPLAGPGKVCAALTRLYEEDLRASSIYEEVQS